MIAIPCARGAIASSGASVSPFSPTSIAGLKLWLKADAGVTYDGSNNVNAWADQSGEGNDAIPLSTEPIFNSSDLNGKPTISLTSMSDNIERVFTISQNPLGATGSTAFSVLYGEDVCDANNDGGAIFGNFGAPSFPVQTHYPYGPDCFVYDSFATTARKEQITPPVSIIETWSLYSVFSTNSNWKSFVNGQEMHSDNSNTYNNNIGGDDTTLYIGKQTGLGNFSFKGKIAEIIIYDSALSIQDREAVEAYLNDKYAIY